MRLWGVLTEETVELEVVLKVWFGKVLQAVQGFWAVSCTDWSPFRVFGNRESCCDIQRVGSFPRNCKDGRINRVSVNEGCNRRWEWIVFVAIYSFIYSTEIELSWDTFTVFLYIYMLQAKCVPTPNAFGASKFRQTRLADFFQPFAFHFLCAPLLAIAIAQIHIIWFRLFANYPHFQSRYHLNNLLRIM